MATTDLTRWLQSSYQLTGPEAAMLMGFSVEYSITDLVGSQVGVSAKMGKQVLKSLHDQTEPAVKLEKLSVLALSSS